MAKARLVRKAIEKAGWRLMSTEGSHRKYRKSGRVEMFAYHDGADLGRPAMARVAKQFGMSTEELRRLL
jgi:predicted RNA binding protein YcfA (HicA-like mRNA interferase family)